MAGEFMQYMDAFNAGAKAPVDAMNYAPQQQARTDILKQEALQSAQQVQMNDVTLKSNMFKLLSAEKAQKQEEQLAALQAAEAQKLQTGQDKVGDLGGIAQNDNALASFYENLAMKEMTVPGGAASAESHSKLAAELRDKATGSRKKAMDAAKDQISMAANIASRVKDQESLADADAQLKAAGIRPPDFPTKWDARAEKYINGLKNSASSAIDKMKADDDHTKTMESVKNIASEIVARRAATANAAANTALRREELAYKKEHDNIDPATGQKITAKQAAAKAKAEVSGKAANNAIGHIQELLDIIDSDRYVTGTPGVVGRALTSVAGQIPLAKFAEQRAILKQHEEAQDKFAAKVNILKATYAKDLVGGGQWTKEKRQLIDNLIPGLGFRDSPTKTKIALQEFAQQLAETAIKDGATNVSMPTFDKKEALGKSLTPTSTKPPKQELGTVTSFDKLPEENRTAVDQVVASMKAKGKDVTREQVFEQLKAAGAFK